MGPLHATIEEFAAQGYKKPSIFVSRQATTLGAHRAVEAVTLDLNKPRRRGFRDRTGTDLEVAREVRSHLSLRLFGDLDEARLRARSNSESSTRKGRSSACPTIPIGENKDRTKSTSL
jgi:hypothetical protein